MDADELKEVLRLHGMWRRSEEGGVRAKLSRADLRGADLNRAKLSGANLYGANLSGANLSGANLYEVIGLAVISAGPLGRNDRITYYKYDIDEVNCGCFLGTLNEFGARVRETHMGNPAHLAAYRAAIEFFHAVREAYAKEGE